MLTGVCLIVFFATSAALVEVWVLLGAISSW